MTAIQALKPGSPPIVFPTESGNFEEPPFEVFPGPKAEVRFTDPNEDFDDDCTIGTSVDIYEEGDLRFPGIVEKRKRRRGIADEVSYTLTLAHRGYRILRNTPCDPYIYDEDGDPVTDRDAVKVNPWERFIFYNPLSSTLDADGNPPFVHGIPIETDFRSLIGTRFVFQHTFQDNSIFLPSQLITPTQQVQVYRDQAFSDDLVSLARTRATSGYRTNSTFLESVSLMNGDPNAGAMGDISSATMYFIGKKSGADDLIVDFCRNAGQGPRTWTSATVVHTGNYLGSGLDLWTCSVTFGGAETQKNRFAFRIRVAGTSTTATTRAFYFAVVAATATDVTGLTEGTVDTYTDPKGLTGAALCVVDDYSGMNRLQAIARLQKTALGSLDPNADMWVDEILRAHFRLRRGADIASPVYDLDDGNITVLDHEEVAEDLAYQVVAIGAGRGAAERVIVDTTAFSAGGLYDATRAPGGINHAGHGIRTYRDTTAQDVLDLRRRSRAYLARRLNKREFFDIEVIPFDARAYVTGDRIPITDAMLGFIAQLLRVTNVKVSWAPNGHKISVRLGEKTQTPIESMAGTQMQTGRDSAKALLQQASAGIGGPGVLCDATHIQRATIAIPEGVEVDRVLLSVTTIPFQFNTRGAASGGGSTQTSTSEEHDHPTGNVDVGLGGSGSDVGEDPFTVGMVESSYGGSTGSFTDFATEFNPGPDATAELDYVEVLWGVYNESDSLHEGRPDFRIVRTNGSFSGEVAAVQDLSAVAESATPQDAEDTIFTVFRVSLRKTTTHPVLTTDNFKLQYKNTSTAGGSWTDVAVAYVTFFYLHYHEVDVGLSGAHEHDVVIPAHVHPPEVGIWAFDGDGGNGNGTPVMGTGELAVDPTLTALGAPSSFDADKFPVAFGDTTKPVTFAVDVTNDLRQSNDGRIAPGEHHVFFRGIAGGAGATANSKGLLAVQVTPILRARQA